MSRWLTMFRLESLTAIISPTWRRFRDRITGRHPGWRRELGAGPARELGRGQGHLQHGEIINHVGRHGRAGQGNRGSWRRWWCLAWRRAVPSRPTGLDAADL